VTATNTDLSNSSYSYVVIRRGKRPTIDSKVIDNHENRTFDFKRIVSSPKKRKGHVMIKTCNQEGAIEDIVVAKSHGDDVYNDARTCHWGDLWPYEQVTKENVEFPYNDKEAKKD
jgi:ribosomal protein RSM22 (predicted rRNA methylase)